MKWYLSDMDGLVLELLSMKVKNNSNYRTIRVLAVALLLLLTLISCSSGPAAVYTVTFDANGGTVNEETTIISDVVEGSTVSRPADPVLDGYAFAGWFVEGNDSEAFNFSTPVNSDLTLVAKWSWLYTVTFDSNGGVFDGEDSILVASGSAVSRPDVEPTREGYFFAGWFIENDDNYYDFSSPVNRNLTLVAVWTAENLLYFTLDEGLGGYIVETGKVKPSGTLVIPGTYDEKPVVSLAINSFQNNTNLTSVAIPASVKTIGNYAFDSCYDLETVIFESNSKLTSIEEKAFKGTAIAYITIPASVETIGDSAFYNCNRLVSVSFEPDSKLSSIGNEAFNSTLIGSSIDIPASVETIGNSAFERCSNLQFVNFKPSSRLSKIGDSAFRNSGLNNIEIPESVTDMGSGVFSGLDYFMGYIRIGTETVPTTWNPDWKDCNVRVENCYWQTIQ